MFLLLAMLTLVACQPALPVEHPDLGVEINAGQLNTEISLALSEGLNSYKIGDFVELELTNHSNETAWEFNVNRDIKIFSLDHGEWVKVADMMTDVGAVDLVLDPKGEFPHGRRGLVVFPDLNATQPVNLRVYVLAHRYDAASSTSITTGAYTDFTLRP